MLTDLDEEQASSDDQDVRAETSNDGTGAKKRVPGDGRPPAAAEPDAASSRRGAASVQDAAQGEDKVSETMIAALKYQSRAAPLIPQALNPMPRRHARLLFPPARRAALQHRVDTPFTQPARNGRA